MKTFVVYRTDYPMEVHIEGCQHWSKKHYSQDWNITGETVEAAVAKEAKQMNSDFEANYSDSELFRIMPCCK